MTCITRRASFLAIVSFTLLLAGCAAPPRTAQEDSAIHSAAIVSMLREDVPIMRMGITVFGNEKQNLDQNGELNRISVEVLERRLRTARPAWTIVKSNADPVALAAKHNKMFPSWTSRTGHVSDDLKKIAKESNVDVLFVLMDANIENSPGRGVGVRLHGELAPMIKPVAVVHANVMLVLVDRNGKELAIGSGGSVTVPASELGLSNDLNLARLSDSPVREQLNGAVRKQLTAMVERAATSMGY